MLFHIQLCSQLLNSYGHIWTEHTHRCWCRNNQAPMQWCLKVDNSLTLHSLYRFTVTRQQCKTGYLFHMWNPPCLFSALWWTDCVTAALLLGDLLCPSSSSIPLSMNICTVCTDIPVIGWTVSVFSHRHWCLCWCGSWVTRPNNLIFTDKDIKERSNVRLPSPAGWTNRGRSAGHDCKILLSWLSVFFPLMLLNVPLQLLQYQCINILIL